MADSDHGEGRQPVRIAPTEQLSASARALLKGQKSTGEVEVMFHDALAAADQLNRMQGAYIERSVSLNVNANVPVPQNVSAEDVLNLWKAAR